MDKKKSLGIVTGTVALVVSIVAVTVAFAAYNRDLTISGSGTVKTAKWSVVFKSGSLSAAQTGNSDSSVTSTAAVTGTAPTLTDTTISTFNVELKTPGDYVYYDFIIKNAGDFGAEIGSTFTLPTPTCTKGASGVDADEAYVCGGTVESTPYTSNLEYTFTYVEDDDTEMVTDSTERVSAGDAVSVGDKYAPGVERKVRLKIQYKTQSGSTIVLPSDDVTVGNLGFTIPFVQY